MNNYYELGNLLGRNKIMKIVIGVNQLRERTCLLNKVPAPNSSRIRPIMVSPKVNPSPIPSPSKIERSGVFLDA